MSEVQLIQGTDFPLTAQSFAEKLQELGVAEGQTILVHMAMSKLGWVVGGAQAVVMGFLEAVGSTGTIMMPAHTNENTDPAQWQHPPVPESWWQTIRDHTPAFNPAITPTRSMGAVAELFRTFPGAVRSNHPVTSFSALGPNAKFLTDNHVLEEDLGDNSPLGRLYELDGYVLLLGVTHWNNTSLHLAEFRANYPGKQNLVDTVAMLVDGKRQSVTYETLKTHSDDFGELGTAFDAAYQQPVGKIAHAEVRFFKQRAVVDFAIDWMEKNRNLTVKAES